jgi:predicted nuclease with TOPRIM domain
MEADLADARQSSEELRVMFDEMTREKELLLEEREESEERYRRTLMNRDGIILDLRRELDKLYDDIYDRDQTITKYESSLRELLGLSVQLTKRRVGRVFRRRETDEFE